MGQVTIKARTSTVHFDKDEVATVERTRFVDRMIENGLLDVIEEHEPAPAPVLVTPPKPAPPAKKAAATKAAGSKATPPKPEPGGATTGD